MSDQPAQKPPPSYPLKSLPERHRPRELFDRLGREGVPEDVLLAILLRSGIPGKNVVQLAQELLVHFDSLARLASATLDELKAIDGIGDAKARELIASFELARRLADEKSSVKHTIDTPDAAARMLKEEARILEEEIFWVLMLDTKNRMHRPPYNATQGILNASLVHPREVFKEAIKCSSAAVILAHNHPSGDPQPSPEDIKITRQLIEAGKIIDIQVLDHIIIGKEHPDRDAYFFSMRESGLVHFEE